MTRHQRSATRPHQEHPRYRALAVPGSMVALDMGVAALVAPRLVLLRRDAERAPPVPAA